MTVQMRKDLLADQWQWNATEIGKFSLSSLCLVLTNDIIGNTCGEYQNDHECGMVFIFPYLLVQY